MRATAGLVLLAALAVGTSGCAGDGSAAKSTAIGQSSTGSDGASGSGGSSDGGQGGGATGGSSPTGSAVCTEVRAGIEAFNMGDFPTTVDHFTAAVPLAHARVVTKDSAAAEDLLAAVVYYAQLAPGDYLQAARSSADFAKYKQITLSQCAGDGSQTVPTPSDPGLAV